MYNVFTDFHHASLLYSLILLFEKRLGGNVYRPIGMDWATEGFWKVYDHPATQEQFLGIGGATPDGTKPLNEVLEFMPTDRTSQLLAPQEGLYFCQDIDSGKFNKAITLSTFYRLPIDIVIASLPQHVEPFRRLCESHPNKPKLIFQIGNQWDTVDTNLVKNVMVSAKVTPGARYPDINYVSYHQEFDLGVFWAGIPEYMETPEYIAGHTEFPRNNIYSFVNVFQGFPDYPLFLDIEKMLPEWRFRAFGGQCRDGTANGSQELANRMREAKFIWHTKAGGDGYGHVLFNSAAVARPLITKRSYYSGKLGENLMIDGETCINIDNLSPFEIVEKIQHYSQPDLYRQMCKKVYSNFRSQVDFDKEEVEIRSFLEKLL